ncbi:MAG: hypothetical protein AAGF23_24625 [Acidobacteriota bacterium]
MSVLIVGLLVVIVIELGIVAYALVGGGGLPWMVDPDGGSLTGKIASPKHHRTLAAKVEYIMCAARYQTELEQQRFRISQGLEPDSDALDFEASPDDVKKP